MPATAPIEVFVVESYWAGVTAPQLADAAARCHAMPDAGYHGSLLLAGDEYVLSLFTARSRSDVVAAAGMAGIPADRVVPALVIGAAAHP